MIIKRVHYVDVMYLLLRFNRLACLDVKWGVILLVDLVIVLFCLLGNEKHLNNNLNILYYYVYIILTINKIFILIIL